MLDLQLPGVPQDIIGQKQALGDRKLIYPFEEFFKFTPKPKSGQPRFFHLNTRIKITQLNYLKNCLINLKIDKFILKNDKFI